MYIYQGSGSISFPMVTPTQIFEDEWLQVDQPLLEPLLMMSQPSDVSFASIPQSGPTDLRHFDPEFTHLPVTSSLCTETLTVTSSIREAAGAFPGFSYGPPADHSFM